MKKGKGKRPPELGDVYKFGKDRLKVVKIAGDLVFFDDLTHATKKELKKIKRVS